MTNLIKINELKKSLYWNKSDYIASLCIPLFKHFNLNYFDYSRFYPDNTCISLFTQAEYVAYFTQSDNYQPPVKFLKPGKYLWQQYLPLNLLQQIQQNFKHYYGLTLVETHETYIELINFSADINTPKVLDLFMYKFDVLQLFVNYFRDEIKPLLTKASRQRIMLPEHQLYENSYEQISHDDIKAFIAEITSTKKIRANQQPIFINNQMIGASAQELACLEHLMQGMSAKETAKVLNLSPRTVELYISKLCKKANVKNKMALASCVQNDGLMILDDKKK